ncbi:MAG TPA: hypothetical protein VMV94_09845, partial [Phycisphaerae bacterium]|nr:hypothetical protein [Phycisphaerae bacterium]
MIADKDAGLGSRILWLTAVAVILLGVGALLSSATAAWAGTLIALACHVPVLFGAWCIVGRLTNRRPDQQTPVVALVLTGQVYLISLMALGLVLGNLGSLNRPMALIWAGVLGLAMMWHGRAFAVPPCDRIGSSLLENGVRSIFLTSPAFACLCAMIEPIYSYDTLTYHLFFPARWVQDGAISIVPTWFGDPAPAYAPSATEVYYTWLMLPLGGDLLARCGQFPFWLLLICAVYAMACELRLRPVARACVALIVGAIPAVLAQAFTAMADLALAAHLVALALFSLRLERRRTIADLIGLALSACLLLGTKFIAVAYLVGVLPVVAWAVWQACRLGLRRLATPTPNRRLVVVAFLLAGLWSGGFWYARNWIKTGNPIYPLGVKVGGREIFAGAYGREQMENSAFDVHRRTDPDVFGQTIWETLHWPDAPFPAPDETGRIPAFRYWCCGPAGLIAALF